MNVVKTILYTSAAGMACVLGNNVLTEAKAGLAQADTCVQWMEDHSGQTTKDLGEACLRFGSDIPIDPEWAETLLDDPKARLDRAVQYKIPEFDTTAEYRDLLPHPAVVAVQANSINIICGAMVLSVLLGKARRTDEQAT